MSYKFDPILNKVVEVGKSALGGISTALDAIPPSVDIYPGPVDNILFGGLALANKGLKRVTKAEDAVKSLTRMKSPPYGTSAKGKYFLDIVQGEGIRGPNAARTVATKGPYKSSKIANNMRNNYIVLEEGQRIGLPYENSGYKFDPVTNKIIKK